jgi:hypothetical protein
MSTATPSLEQLLETILARPAADRAVIAEVVADSLHPPDPEIEQAILEVVRQRIAAYETGELETISGEEVFRELDEELRRS